MISAGAQAETIFHRMSTASAGAARSIRQVFGEPKKKVDVAPANKKDAVLIKQMQMGEKAEAPAGGLWQSARGRRFWGQVLQGNAGTIEQIRISAIAAMKSITRLLRIGYINTCRAISSTINWVNWQSAPTRMVGNRVTEEGT
jgi:hypothetical protein